MKWIEPDVTSRARVLIVEDEGIVSRDLHQSLVRLGHSVCGSSATGADAVVQAERTRPDIILMDIRLRAEMDGIDAARLIRDKQDVPIVFLTAYADRETLTRAASVGPYGYVLKPFDERDLQVALLMALCKHRAFAALDQQVQQRTEELMQTEARYRRLQVLAELGLFALGTPNTEHVLQHAVEVVAQALEVDFVGVFELDEDSGGTVSLRAGVGWKPGWVGNTSIRSRGDGLLARAVGMNAPVHVRELGGQRSVCAAAGGGPGGKSHQAHRRLLQQAASVLRRRHELLAGSGKRRVHGATAFDRRVTDPRRGADG